jgi:hypothetical protein
MVTNLGPVPASAVALTNTLPAVLSFEGISVPLGMTYVTNQNEVIFNIGSMTNGQTAAMSIIATAISTGSSGEATNSAVAGDSLDDSAFGNGSASAVTTITNAPPPFSNLTVVPGVTSAFITWNTPSNSTSQVDYGLTAGTSNYSWLNPVLTNYHVVLLTGLVPDTNYYFQAISIVPAVPASDTTNNSIIAVSAGLPSVTYSTNGTFSTPSTLFQQTTDASYSGTGWFAGGATPGIYSYNGDYVYDYVQGVGGYPTSSATYAPNIVVPGLYDVSVWYPSKPGYFTSNAPMYATGATNVVLVYVNQTINGGSWQPLTTGLFLTNGTAGNLTIYNDSGDTSTSVVANGVRWAYELAQDTPASGAVPAWWAEFYFGTNVSGTNVVNGNRYSNYAEYVLGTDPTSPSSQLQFMVAPGPSTNVTVSFAPFQGGRSYQLLSSTNLRNGAWVTLTNTPSQNTNDGSGFFTVGHAPGSPAYYKLSVSLSTTQ